MKYTLVKNNIIKNIVEADEQFIIDNLSEYDYKIGRKWHKINDVYTENYIALTNVYTNINVSANIDVLYMYESETGSYELDTTINKNENVYLDGEAVTTVDIVNGIGSIPFESAEAGTFKIRVENSECEVVVNA